MLCANLINSDHVLRLQFEKDMHLSLLTTFKIDDFMAIDCNIESILHKGTSIKTFRLS